MTRYSLEPKTRKYAQGFGFLLFVRDPSDKYVKTLCDTPKKAGLYAANTASKKAVPKIPETTGDLIGIKLLQKL